MPDPLPHDGDATAKPSPRDGKAGAPGDRREELTLGILDARLDGSAVDVLVAGDRIVDVVAAGEGAVQLSPSAYRLAARGQAVVPGLMNAHTHVPMAMLRGYADDMPLVPWLREKIWPFEAGLNEEDVYWGARLGCLEMLRTGTTFLNDMYWHVRGVARAVADSGLRAVLAGVLIERGEERADAAAREQAVEDIEALTGYGPRIQPSLGPHAIYTVSEAGLRWVAETAASRQLPVHLHLSETEQEVRDCVARHGLRPAAYVERLGLLGPRTYLAHCVHLDEDEIALLAERGAHPLHNPVSNLKLASGGPMPYGAMRQAGLRPLIGSDGNASNNNLDMYEELKFAALLAKHAAGDPTALTASDALAMATTDAARAFDVPAGSIAPGRLADLCLIDLDHPLMAPGHDLEADLVYSAGGRAVTTTVCGGRVLMEEGMVEGQAEVLAEVRARVDKLLAYD